MGTALFVGAGAARAIGYPFMSKLLPRVCTELKSAFSMVGVTASSEESTLVLKLGKW